MKRLTLLAILFYCGAMQAQEIESISNPDTATSITPTQNNSIKHKQQKSRSGGIIVLDFEGLGNNDPIKDFYNGGLSGQGNSGVNYGIEFGTALGKIDADAGGNGNFANEPSPSTVMFFLDSKHVSINVASGFTTAFSLYYSAGYDGSFEVYDGLSGTGNLLASASLPANGHDNNCSGDPNGWYCNWDPVGVTFTGTAKSIVFIGDADYIAFDDVTFGSPNPGPPPTPLSNWSLIFGVLLIAVFIIFRFKRIIA